MSQITFNLSLPETITLAKKLAEHANVGDVIALWGDLGTGKTTFARAFIQALNSDITEVPSPTFTLLQVYDSMAGPIWHVDLYRLKDPEEVLELGIEDAFYQAICLIEWPERLEYLLPKHRLDIKMEILDSDRRQITLVSIGNKDDRFQTTIESLASLFKATSVSK